MGVRSPMIFDDIKNHISNAKTVRLYIALGWEQKTSSSSRYSLIFFQQLSGNLDFISNVNEIIINTWNSWLPIIIYSCSETLVASRFWVIAKCAARAVRYTRTHHLIVCSIWKHTEKTLISPFFTFMQVEGLKRQSALALTRFHLPIAFVGIFSLHHLILKRMKHLSDNSVSF